MKNKISNIKVSDVTLFLQFFIIGLVCSESMFLSIELSKIINSYISKKYDCTTILIASIICFISLLIFTTKRTGISDLIILIKSKRIDLLGLFIIGLYFSFENSGLGSKTYKEIAHENNQFTILSIVGITLIILNTISLKWGTSYIFLAYFKLVNMYKRKEISLSSVLAHISTALSKLKNKVKYGISFKWIFQYPQYLYSLLEKKYLEESTPPIFVSDDAILNSEADFLGFDEKARIFSENVLNGGSKNSLVFGLDAPWGAGKSSFINLCTRYWNNNKKIITYRFEPLRYDEKSDLTKFFISDLVKTIKNNVYAPSLGSEFEKYFKQVKPSKKISIFGVDLEFNPSNMDDSIEDTIDKLNDILEIIDHKIIIIIDDLDRLSWDGVKNILFAIKRSFMLKNMTYVLCYDTENIITYNKNQDALHVIEFLEKFINVKISLFPTIDSLKKYITENLEAALHNNKQRMIYSDPQRIDKIKESLSFLSSSLDSQDHLMYRRLIGDIRKIKRIINTVLALDIDKMDHRDGDFDKEDLLNLILIYINFPTTFRDIYDSETSGKSEHFSITKKLIGTKHELSNSSFFEEYLESKTSGEKFLLNKIFSITSSSPSELALATKAKFNSERTSKNLQRYLDLITNRIYTKDRFDTYKFMERHRVEIINGKPIDEVLSLDEFSFKNGEYIPYKLWSTITNTISEAKDPSYIIKILLESLPSYSLLHFQETISESRKSLTYCLVRILNDAGWGSNEQARRYNTPENLAEISQWIFGEGKHINQSIIESLYDSKRGILGLYDVLLFRLCCSADRNVGLFNLQNALAYHENPNATTSGITTDLAKQQMREISQKIFTIFKERYIEKNICIFSEVKHVTQEDILGKNNELMEKFLLNGKITQEQLNTLIEGTKNIVLIFCIYQLTNPLIMNGVGCGYYDEQGGNNGHGIFTTMNNYLFDICFDEKNDSKIENFIDYILMTFEQTFTSLDNINFVPAFNNLVQHIDKNRLISYWKINRTKILGLDLIKKTKTIYAMSYSASYSEDLQSVYDALDEYCK